MGKHLISAAMQPNWSWPDQCGANSASNENKMSDGGRGRALLGVEGWNSSQKWVVQRSAVRSIAWLGMNDWLLNQARGG